MLSLEFCPESGGEVTALVGTFESFVIDGDYKRLLLVVKLLLLLFLLYAVLRGVVSGVEANAADLTKGVRRC